MTPASIRAVAKVMREHGSDAWFKRTPQELLAQLAIGGRMVIPVGTNAQTLYLIERTNIDSKNDYKQTKLEAVKFVPLLGGIS
jgi:protein-L-isoaspartate(D-aspartate) O-methyltransferase